MLMQIGSAKGFIAALDQSGGSTPGALFDYGYAPGDYADEDAMFELVHAMRVRVMTSPSFSGQHVIGAILFERTMDGLVEDIPAATYLWRERGIVPFLKIDKGLEQQRDGVRPMKPIHDLKALLDRARKFGIFGTKMRSVVSFPSDAGIREIVRQQFDLARQIADRGLLPIIEPEILLDSADRALCESMLHAELSRALDDADAGLRCILKLTLPVQAGLYDTLATHPKVVRIVALSGGFSQREACIRLARNRCMIASFSRVLLAGLRHDLADDEFNATLEASVERIFKASTEKAAA